MRDTDDPKPPCAAEGRQADEQVARTREQAAQLLVQHLQTHSKQVCIAVRHFGSFHYFGVGPPGGQKNEPNGAGKRSIALRNSTLAPPGLWCPCHIGQACLATCALLRLLGPAEQVPSRIDLI